jgi:hypothetical protein
LTFLPHYGVQLFTVSRAQLLRGVDADHVPAAQSLDSLTLDEMVVRTVRPTLAQCGPLSAFWDRKHRNSKR